MMKLDKGGVLAKKTFDMGINLVNVLERPR
jgi:hypothetical protein